MAVSGGFPSLIDLRRLPIQPGRFVGRADELAALRDSSPPVTLVLGEPGSGKTRLLEEASSARETRHVKIVCHSCVDAVPYEPLLTVAAELAATTVRQSRWTRPTEVERLITIREILERASDETCVLIQIDDLQWADDLTVDAIPYLADRLRHQPIRWHVAARIGEERSERLAARLTQVGVGAVSRLRELNPTEFRSFVAALFDRPIDDARISELYALSGGNPLYAEQLIAATLSGEASHATGVRLLLAERVKYLAGEHLQVAKTMAVYADIISPLALSKITLLSSEALSSVIQDLELRRIVKTSSEGATFRHELIRRECYGQIPPDERIALHASMLHLVTDVWRRTHHLDGSENRQEAARGLLYHGLAMIDRGDRLEADAALRGVVERSTEVGDAVRLRADAGLAATAALAGDTEKALTQMRRFETAATCLGMEEKVDARSRFAEAIFEGSDDCSLASPFLDSAVSDAAKWAPESLPRLYALAGAVADRSGASREAESALRLGLKACSLSTPTRDRVRLLSWLGVVHGRLGDPERGIKEAEEAAQIAAADGLSAEYSQCCLKCCYLSDLRGDREGYEAWCRRGLDCPGVKLPRVTAVLRLNLATALKDRGALREALDAGTVAYEEAQRGSAALRAQAASSLALTNAMLGRFEDASALVAQLVHVHAPDRWSRAIEFVSGRVSELSGDLDKALQHYSAIALLDAGSNLEAFDVRAKVGEARTLYCLGRFDDLLSQIGWLADASLPQSQLMQGLRSEVEAYAMIARGDRAAGRTKMLAAAKSSKERFRSAELRALAALVVPNSVEINAAIADFDAMGAEAASEKLRCKARGLGLRPRHRPRSTLDMKTSEVRITKLIRVGKTNAEIGDQLGLSTRTVEHYVSNMLSKFGVRFRAQLVAIIDGDDEAAKHAPLPRAHSNRANASDSDSCGWPEIS
jgi:DNA-binding NarL/FixJ family response regulator